MSYILEQVVQHGGVLFRKEQSTHVVSFWELPGGYMVDQAEVHTAFFSNAVEAETFAAKYSTPPEMADCLPLSDERVNVLFSFEQYGKNAGLPI